MGEEVMVGSIDNGEKNPHDLALPQDEVHVWRASLNASMTQIADIEGVLSDEEIRRANKYYFCQHRRRYIVGRGLLRTILGRYLEMPADSLSFDYSCRGKPELADICRESGIRFNLSHSGVVVIFAITRDRSVGVDVEDQHRALDMDKVIRRSCSKREKADLKNVPQEMKRQAFFNCWTRKEAYVKAHGDGLAMALNQFSVSLIPGEPARLLDNVQDARWSLQEIDAGAGYIAAVAAEGHDWQIRNWG